MFLKISSLKAPDKEYVFAKLEHLQPTYSISPNSSYAANNFTILIIDSWGYQQIPLASPPSLMIFVVEIMIIVHISPKSNQKIASAIQVNPLFGVFLLSTCSFPPTRVLSSYQLKYRRIVSSTTS